MCWKLMERRWPQLKKTKFKLVIIKRHPGKYEERLHEPCPLGSISHEANPTLNNSDPIRTRWMLNELEAENWKALATVKRKEMLNP